MLSPPKLFPDNKNLFWVMVGISVLSFTFTICFAILTGKISSFSANGEGISLVTTDDAIALVDREQEAYKMVETLRDREKALTARIKELEDNPVYDLPFIPKPTTPEVSSEITVGEVKVSSKEFDQLLEKKLADSKDAKTKLEVIRSYRQQQQQAQQGIFQQQQQVGPTK